LAAAHWFVGHLRSGDTKAEKKYFFFEKKKQKTFACFVEFRFQLRGTALQLPVHKASAASSTSQLQIE
jgi:hypothetical protein